MATYKDGESSELFIEARSETVQLRKEASAFSSYRLKSKGRKLAADLRIGDVAADGRVCLIESPREINRFVDGAILVTQTTDPDCVPIIKRAAAWIVGLIHQFESRSITAVYVATSLVMAAVMFGDRLVLNFAPRRNSRR